MFNILIAEDEHDICNMISEYLGDQGFNVYKAYDGEKALCILNETHIDLLITDVMMPKINGFALTKELRHSGFDTPILMITAKESIDDKEMGFKNGTDDYMVKPIILREMLLRVHALLKRAKISHERKIVFPNSFFDLDSLTANINNKNIYLPNKEFMLLYRLLSSPNKIFTKQQLLDEIWGYDTNSLESTVTVHISRLREKLSQCTDFEIVTVKGIGVKAVLK